MLLIFRKKHEVTFLLSYFSMTKSTKSQQGGLAPSSFRTTGGVHELVAGSSAWRVRAANSKVKIGSFATLRNLNYTTRANISHERAEQIRARIVCTPAYIGAAGVNRVSARTGFPKQTLILLCSHPVPHPNLNREVRHSPTWHSSESESALERFEPVAVTML